MLVSDFDYQLPPESIAQHPLKQRDRSRLLLLNRNNQELWDNKFCELPELVSREALIVVNNCRVIPARIFGRRKTGARLELTLLKKISSSEWECLVKGKKPRPGEEVELDQGKKVIFREELDLDAEAGVLGGLWRIKLSDDTPQALEELGVPPLPPYLRRKTPQEYEPDRARYQTVFASRWGAVAAPTAGLHFTRRVLSALKEKGVEIVELTLYVSFGTFAPVRVDRVEKHKVHKEKFEVGEAAAERINRAKSAGRKIIAVGTTVCRTLETVGDPGGTVLPGKGETDLFIYPGYQFRVVDGLLTNFHLPRSSLLMLVAAFAGLEPVKKAYQHALESGYRFLSYGDCMLIL